MFILVSIIIVIISSFVAMFLLIARNKATASDMMSVMSGKLDFEVQGTVCIGHVAYDNARIRICRDGVVMLQRKLGSKFVGYRSIKSVCDGKRYLNIKYRAGKDTGVSELRIELSDKNKFKVIRSMARRKVCVDCNN